MPHYDFFCHACQKTFSKILTIAEHGKEKIKMPHCGSNKVEQRWAEFYAVTSKEKRLNLFPTGRRPRCTSETSALAPSLLAKPPYGHDLVIDHGKIRNARRSRRKDSVKSLATRLSPSRRDPVEMRAACDRDRGLRPVTSDGRSKTRAETPQR